jgi:hypothetical protein
MLQVAHIRNFLEAEGIRCRLRNEFLAGAAGELPPIQCWPEVWVDDLYAQRARELVAELVEQDRDDVASPWQCPSCGEWVEGNFRLCWNCDTPAPEKDQ